MCASLNSSRDEETPPNVLASFAVTGKNGSLPEIPVTEAMIDAGLEIFREHHYDTDIRWMLESVFRAMVYESILPTSTTSVR
jgi:hypothetical protein